MIEPARRSPVGVAQRWIVGRENERKRPETDDVSDICPKCGEKHVLGSIKEIDSAPSSTLCKKCGFLYLNRIIQKFDALITLLQSDPKAVSLLRADEMDKLNAYIEDRQE